MENKAAQKKSHKTRAKIIDAYIELMKHKNFDEIAVKAIVEQANITRGTFYLYFSDIYEMVTYMEEMLLSNMPTVTPNIHEKPGMLILPTYEECQDNSWEFEWFEYYELNNAQFNALLGPHGDASFYRKVKKKIQDAVLTRMQQDNMPDDTNRDYFLNLIPDLFLLLAHQWTNNSKAEFLDINSITKIISTIRIGSLYLHHLEFVKSLENNNNQGVQE